ncbi:MAG: SPFH domain-containing protein [Verrucomicrobiae bacterium]|nr:SPFH domain-containing protein [Verrucomicrobiae bacterium]
MRFLQAFFLSFAAWWVLVPLVLAVARALRLYVVVNECEAKVYVLFGKVVSVIDQPGFHCLWLRMGPAAALLPFFGRVHTVDLRLDQEYLRSQPVNSEEGTPMGVGVWYEMRVSNPSDFLFQNADPRGSLRANVSNAAVRCLSNMPLGQLLENRHGMSRVVRSEVSPRSAQWGYRLGSVYIRKVHFRDKEMIRQIEQKVVNRLRQVTSAIRQAGANQVGVIRSAAEKEAATEFARAAAMRPHMLHMTLREVSSDPEVLGAIFDTLEVDRILRGEAEINILPPGSLLAQLIASRQDPGAKSVPHAEAH